MLVKEKLWKNWRFILPALALLLGLALSAGGAFAGVPTSSPAMPSAGAKGATDAKANEQPFDCSLIQKLGIDKQMNIHAQQIMAACSGIETKPGNGDKTNLNLNSLNSLAKNYPGVYGGTDSDVILPEGTYPHVTQSESMVWGHGNTVVVNYNDSKVASSCYAGYSYSTDSGTTWTRPGGAAASPVCSGHGTNYGDPIVVYDEHLAMWFLGDLATGCGGQGVGLWTSTDGMTYTPGACAHNGTQDDRESMWVDNTASSPHYGRMYVSLNDFAIGGGALRVVYSDNGTTWSTPSAVTSAFIRDVQITGGPDGTVFLATMDEGGGGLNTRQNIMQRSTDGGTTWTAITMGARFPAPGVATSGYFAMMFPTIWRFMGWGQPAAGQNQVVSYVYTQHGTGSDAADMMYTRSTDNGTTWGTPLQLNTDTTTRPNWQGSLATTANGTLLASWYDGREAASCGTPGSTTPCYRRYGRVSADNGATWQTDDMIGDAMSPLPAQPDTTVQTVYEGDYDYSSANGQVLYTTWNDGRTLVNGTSQQDVYFDKVVGGPTWTPTITPSCAPNCTATRTVTRTVTPSPTPTVCGMYNPEAPVNSAIVPGTDDSGNHGDDVVTSINLPFTVHFYNDQSYTSANVSSNGNLQFTTQITAYTNECLPSTTLGGPAIMPFWDDLRTDTTGSCTPGPCGVYTSVTGNTGSRVFNIEWRAFYFSGTGSANFEIQLHEDTPDFDLIYGPISGATNSATIGVQDGATTNPRYTEIVCNADMSQYLNKRIHMTFAGCGPSPTRTRSATPCPSCTSTRTVTPTATATCATGYNYATSAGTIVPGTTDTGNHTDDGITTISLPFPFSLYGTPYNTANISSNGNLQFTTTNTIFTNSCLPATTLGPSIHPHWDDLRTDDVVPCPSGPCGVYTSVTGSSPNRIFNIEWRAGYFAGSGNANFEIRLYEAGPSHFDVVIGTVDGGGTSATIGVQDGANSFTQYECNTSVNNNTRIAFTLGSCGTPARTNTPTPPRTNTPGGNTATRTRTAVRTGTPQRTITPCGQCNMDTLAVVQSCYLDGTVHWIAIIHNPDACGVTAPWRAELQVRTNGGTFRTVRIQYATSYFGSGDTIWDGFFCYHFSSNVRDVRVEWMFEDQARMSQGSNSKVQEKAAAPNSYSTTPSGVEVGGKNGNPNRQNPEQCTADMTSVPMAPCDQSNGGCSIPPTPFPTGVATRAPILPTK